MSLVDRISGTIARRSRLVIVVLLLLSVVVGAKAVDVDQSSSLDQFQSESDEARALEYVEANFSTGPKNTTTAQVIVRDGNVLSQSALLDQLRFERDLRENETVEPTLAGDQSVTGLANVVATTAIRREQARELAQRRRALNATVDRLTAGLNETRRLQREYDRLNRSRANGEIDAATYQSRADEIESSLADARTNATVGLDAEETASYRQLLGQTRTLQGQLDALNASYQAGQINQSTYQRRAGEIRTQFEGVYAGVQGVLADEFRAFQDDAAALSEASVAGERPPLADQIDKLESMNESQVDGVLTTILSDGGAGGAGGAFAFVPTSFEPGSTEASATMLVVTQVSDGGAAQGSAGEPVIDAQLAMRDIAEQRFGEENALVFGGGIISHEITQSMSDSLVIVGPLALLFVLVVLVIAYRDLLDILLGLLGIGLVLVWAFGFMGWTDIAFNQIFIAIPVLLIGLSIDYAIHVFMRHREERERQADEEGDDLGVRGSMRVALASVGVALTWVTATTVIGFLSNLTSSVPPIREFGVVSAFGIVAALLIFGALIPAMKVEVDELLESWGLDRRKRAFGTGGGRFSQLLAGGTTLARRAPFAVIAIALLISAGGAYGATQVDTSFQQTDFIADDPPDWMKDLPEPFAPGEYDAKQNLEYVNDNFVREDSQAQVLVRGDVTADGALERIDRASTAAGESDVTVVLSNGEPAIRSPLTVINGVAAANESFNATVAAADTDGDGVPDRNLESVYDGLYAAAPDRARSVVYRTGEDDYRALRLVVSTRGGASSSLVTDEMRDVAATASGGGLTAIATGRPVVFDIVQDDLLDTVIQSLLITLVAVFAFLMVTYRITDGSATLGFVTLLPVVLSASWILGTMYLADIPFNVLTGMITSLTIGLGVAYSIHVSERYAHELERIGDVWGAMRRTIVGTGGALLGSAATTVGGFGVLVFAILPPLQQFGLITGLTIVYAFLASVLVLPSLLVVWTRYLGPDGVFPGDDETPDDGTVGEAGAGDGPDESGAPVPPAGTGAATARREVHPSVLGPGQPFSGSVHVGGHAGRVVLAERVPGVGLELASVDPDPVDAVHAGQTLYVAWDLPAGETATVAYEAMAPPGSGDGAELTFDGTLETETGSVTVTGRATVTVVESVARRLLARETVSGEDIRSAGAALRDGDLSHEEFQRLVARWLGRASDGQQAATDDPGGEDGTVPGNGADPGPASNGATGDGAAARGTDAVSGRETRLESAGEDAADESGSETGPEGDDSPEGPDDGSRTDLDGDGSADDAVGDRSRTGLDGEDSDADAPSDDADGRPPAGDGGFESENGGGPPSPEDPEDRTDG